MRIEYLGEYARTSGSRPKKVTSLADMSDKGLPLFSFSSVLEKEKKYLECSEMPEYIRNFQTFCSVPDKTSVKAYGKGLKASGEPSKKILHS